MKIEMNIRPSFGRHARYDCRIIVVVVVVVTGKRGHRVYVSRDDVAEEPRMSQFRAAGVVAPDHRQPVPRRVPPSVMFYAGCGTAQGQRRRGVSISRSRAHPGIPDSSHCFHHLTAPRREKWNWNARGLNEAYDSSKDKIVATCHRGQRSATGNFVILIEAAWLKYYLISSKISHKIF